MSKNTWRTAALLAALTVTPQLVGDMVSNTSLPVLGISTAQAQPRFGTPEWERNRSSRRANHYRDSDLARLSWATVRGRVTSNPNRDLFEFRSERGENFRVLVRDGVSLRDIDRNDRAEVYGKRDGNILIAYRVRELDDDDDRNDNDFRATVVENLSGNRFTIRHNNRIRTVVAERGEPYGLARGREVELKGRWRGDTFYASSVRLRDGGWNNNNNNNDWRNGQRVEFSGEIIRAERRLNTWFYTVRTRKNGTVIVRFHEAWKVGTKVEVEGVMQNNVVVASDIDRDD